MPIVTLLLEPWSNLSRAGFEVKFDPVEIRAALSDTGGVLRIPIEVEPNELGYGAVLLAVEGWLKLGDPSGTNLGIAVPMRTRFPNSARHIEVPLTFHDIANAEARRGGGDMSCHLTLGGLASVPFRPRMDYQGAQELITEPVHDKGGIPFRVPREHWLKLLAEFGLERSRLVELPLVIGPAATEWRQCIGLLERASTEFRSGRDQTAIATCRLVVEGLMTVVANRWGVARSSAQSVPEWLKELEGRVAHVWPEDKEAAAVRTGLYRAVWSWSSESHHYSSRTPLAVGLTASLLTHPVMSVMEFPVAAP